MTAALQIVAAGSLRYIFSVGHWSRQWRIDSDLAGHALESCRKVEFGMKFPTLTTSRLLPRPFVEADAEPLHRILNEDSILCYFPRPAPPDLARVEHLIDGQLQHWEEHGLGWWAVELADTGEFLGWNGLQYLSETAKWMILRRQ